MDKNRHITYYIFIKFWNTRKQFCKLPESENKQQTGHIQNIGNENGFRFLNGSSEVNEQFLQISE